MPSRSRSRGRGKGRDKDAEVLQALLSNAPGGWSALVERHGPAVRAVVRLVLDRYREPASPEDIDEVFSEVFERAAADRFQWLRALGGPDMLGPSLRALAAWRTLGLLRVKYRAFTCSLEAEARLGKHHVATAVLARPPAQDRAPYLTRGDVDKRVDGFLKEIGQRPAGILEAVYKHGRSYQQIAEKQGMPTASVAQALYEGRRRLAEILTEAAPEAGL